MKYYKKIRADNSIVIGGQDIIPCDSIEITEEEYAELYQYIQENAVHITSVEYVENE